MQRWLPVIARNSSFAYRGRTIDVKAVGRMLGARYVLEGSVRKAGNRVRVTGQLIDATTGHHVWAERYDRVLEDLFAIQDELTDGIVGALEAAAMRVEARARPPQAAGQPGCVGRRLARLVALPAIYPRGLRRCNAAVSPVPGA
jgi:hypothetical protein